MSQYVREHWGPERGFPSGPVYGIAQTTDGYLWVGSEAGMVRFDGLGFRLIRKARASQLDLEQPLSQALGVTAGDAGTLWIRLRGLNLLRYQDGEFFDVSRELDQASAGVTVVSRASSGDLIFVTRRNGLFLLHHQELEKIAEAASMPASPVLSVARAKDGGIWMGTRDDGLASLHGAQTAFISKGLPDQKINCVLPLPNGDLWAGTDKGIVRWDGKGITQDGVPPELRRAKTLAMIQDRDENIWVGSDDGLFRVNTHGAARLDASPHEAITALLEDREGNLWTGGANGIERLRDSVFATYSIANGLPSDANGPVYADVDDQNSLARLWFAPIEGGLYSHHLGKVTPLVQAGLDKDVVYSIAGRNGELWIGRQRGGLTHLKPDSGSFQSTTYAKADGLAQNSVFAVSTSRDGAVWAGTLSGGVSRFLQGRFTTYTTADGLASNSISSILEDSTGAMWFATPGGLSALKDGAWRSYRVAEGLPSENVNCLYQSSSGTLWIGTLGGLAYFQDGRIHTPNIAADAAPFLRDQIFGIAEDNARSLWITTENHVVRVRGDRLGTNALSAGDLREYGLADGLKSLGGVRRSRSVVADPRGRIWLSMSRGISVVDTARIARQSVSALVHIQSVAADGTDVPLKEPVRIAAGPQRITLNYAGLSLAIPERTRFRYMLEGFDHGWSGSMADREAVYTNLGPGPYRFRVVASNQDEVFDGAEADLSFRIEPLFWQTWWFYAASLLAFALMLSVFVRSRMRRLALQMSVRFEERLAERTRIAQELHDTLLQGFLSASMQLHVAADGLPADSPSKPALGRILDLMRRVIDEGRNAVRDLRSGSADPPDLQHAFSQLEQELDTTGKVAFRMIVEGKPRPLHPVLRDEIYRIAREALVNAFRHSHASSIEVEMDYAPREFRIWVRDNGCGIDPLVLQSGREGHWGLPGMRERAERIGARLRVWSRPSGGTEVELSVPGKIAFQIAPRQRSRKWFSRMKDNMMKDRDLE